VPDTQLERLGIPWRRTTMKTAASVMGCASGLIWANCFRANRHVAGASRAAAISLRIGQRTAARPPAAGFKP
jgi:hypothetical protein